MKLNNYWQYSKISKTLVGIRFKELTFSLVIYDKQIVQNKLLPFIINSEFAASL